MKNKYSTEELCFMISFSDEKLLCPIIDPIVFIGMNLDGDKEERWYFQDAESHLVLGSYPRTKKADSDEIEVQIYSFREKDLCHIYNLQGMHEDLAKCVARRNSELK